MNNGVASNMEIYIKQLLILLLMMVSWAMQGQHINSTKELIQHMMKVNKNDAVKSYTFVQKTIRYKDGEGPTKNIWYEAIQYPTSFRIDFGPKEDGKAVIYRNDSVYVIQDHKILRREQEYQDFLLVEGGMYQYKSYKKVLERLKEFGYDISKFHVNTYQGYDVYVFGADKGDLTSKQMWIDKDYLFIHRKFTKLKNGKLLEVQYDDFKKVEGRWIETKVLIFIDGKLFQEEYYTDIDMSANLPKGVFEPNNWKTYWYEK